jgi:hypothetical protein
VIAAGMLPSSRIHQIIDWASLRALQPAQQRIKSESGAAPRFQSYGVPLGAPAICHEKARNDDAVRSIAGSTVE